MRLTINKLAPHHPQGEPPNHLSDDLTHGAPISVAAPEPTLALTVRAEAVGNARPPFAGEAGGFARWRRRKWAGGVASGPK